jgi:hypothetical protein
MFVTLQARDDVAGCNLVDGLGGGDRSSPVEKRAVKWLGRCCRDRGGYPAALRRRAPR